MFPRRSIPRLPIFLTVASVALLRASLAHAADPTTAECLIAHEEGVELRAKHELRAARSELQRCSAQSCPAGLRSTCAAEANQVGASIPTLILDAVDAAGNDVSHVRVMMDGRPLIERIDGSAVAVEPGAHKFTFQVAKGPSEEKTLVMTEGEKDKRVRIEIAPPPPPPSHEGETQRAIGLVFTGAAVVSAGIATGFGLSARSSLAKSHTDCANQASPQTCTNEPLAASELSTATTQATIATGGFISAVAFLSAGALLYFTAPTGPRASTAAALNVVSGFGPGGGSLLLRGTF